jgi:CRP-like cAMP-binding protein
VLEELGVIKKKKNKETVFRILKSGDHFGELSFFTNCKREYTVISDKFSSLFVIKQSDFIKIITSNLNRQDFVNLNGFNLFIMYMNRKHSKCYKIN